MWTQVAARLSLNSVAPFREYGFNNLRQACTLLIAQSSLSVSVQLESTGLTYDKRAHSSLCVCGRLKNEVSGSFKLNHPIYGLLKTDEEACYAHVPS